MPGVDKTRILSIFGDETAAERAENSLNWELSQIDASGLVVFSTFSIQLAAWISPETSTVRNNVVPCTFEAMRRGFRDPSLRTKSP